MNKDNSGFTLVELLLVTAIIGLLSSIAVAGYGEYRAKAYSTTSMAALRAGISDMESYIMLENYQRDINGSATMQPDGTLQIHDDWNTLASSITLSKNTSAYMRTTNCGLLHTDQYLVVAHNLNASSRHSFIKSCDGRQGFFTIAKPVGDFYEVGANDTPGHFP